MAEPSPSAGEKPSGGIVKGLFDAVKTLPAPLLLVAVLVLVGLWLFIRADPPQIWPALIILGVSVGLGFCVYVLDQRRQSEANLRRQAEESQHRAEADRREAEGAEKALRRLVETIVPIGGEHRDTWTRPMLQLPLGPDVVRCVFQALELALSEAGEAFSGLPDANINMLRANVFLPTSEGVRDGDVCNLIIPRHENYAPNGLQLNMRKGDELKITFRPNQGATGRVFVERRAVGVLTHPDWLNEQDKSKREKIERWIWVELHPGADLSKPGESLRTELGISHFEMNALQDRQVAEDLTWIISMPIFLKIGSKVEVVGVFNVDCLGYQLKPEKLRSIFYRVAPFAGVLSGVMQGLPTDRVAILRFRE